MLRSASSTLFGVAGARRVLVGVLVGLVLIGCSAPVASTSPSPTAPGARTASLDANQAAALRMRVDVALGAHVMLLARTADAGVGVRTDEFAGYGAMVHEQTGALASQLQDISGSGDTGPRAKQLLSGLDIDMIDYVTAGFKKDAGAQAAAMAAVSGGYVPGMADLLAPITGLDKGTLAALLTAQIDSARAMVDAEIAGGDWTGVFGAVGAAYQGAATLGDALVAGIARRQAKRYPGDPSAPGSTLQTRLAMRLQEQVYLSGFAASAAVGKRADELAGARAALAASQADVAAAMAPIGSVDVAKVAPALSDAEGAVADDAVAVAGKDQAAQAQAEARLTDGFPGGFGGVARKAGLSGDAALALMRAVGQSLRELAEAEGTKSYALAPSASRDAARATTGLAKGLAGAMVKTYAGEYR